LRDAQGGKFGGNPTGRLKRCAIAYADAELEEIDRAWRNLADAARWFSLGTPKSGNKTVAEAMAAVREDVAKLDAALGSNPPRTPPARR
jgi:hypothetical protein